MKHEDNTSDQVMSVHIGTMGMNVTEESLRVLCNLKRDSLVYIHATERMLKKLIVIGNNDSVGDKNEYLSMANELLDIKEHYEQIASLSLIRDGKEVEQAE